MKNKPDFFNKEVKIDDYIFYQSDSDKHDRVYVPRTKESFIEFIDKLWSLTENPTGEEIENFELVKEYPFLFPKNRWDGGMYLYDNNKFKRWFDYTEVDWLLKMNREKTLELLKNLGKEFDRNSDDMRYSYMIMDIKEKYYSLRWYDSGNTDEGFRLIDEYCDYISENHLGRLEDPPKSGRL